MTQVTNPPIPPPAPATVLSMFSYDAALAVVKDNPAGLKFLQDNKTRLIELGTQAGEKILQEIIASFAAGRNRDAWNLFYGETRNWATLAQGAAEDVTNTAAMAQRWNDLGQWLQDFGIGATKVLFALLVAGFLG